MLTEMCFEKALPFFEASFFDENRFLNYIENKKLIIPEPHFYPQSVGHMEEHTVAEGCVFVCGDNRSNSLDSRWVGDIDERKILGKVLFRVFPNPQVIKDIEYNK